MIRINRPAAIPNKLLEDGLAADIQNRNDYDKDPEAYINCLIEFNILNGIYGHPSVKSVLKAAQHFKCCFCEKDQKEENGAVEHFRPKMGFKDRRRQAIQKPGYFWLGYTWSNLMFSCSRCNGAKFKGNLFPLRPGSTRARSHNDDMALEQPFLIDPASVDIDPRDHIYFEREFVKSKTEYGHSTIQILGLDRQELNDMRRKVISDIKSRILTVRGHKMFDPDDVREAKQYLIDAQLPTAHFSSVAIDFISGAGVDLTT